MVRVIGGVSATLLRRDIGGLSHIEAAISCKLGLSLRVDVEWMPPASRSPYTKAVSAA